MRVRVVGVVCAVAVMLSGCAGSGGEEKPPLTTATSSAVETGVGSEATDEPTESVPVYVPLDEAEVGDVVEVEVPVKPEPSAAMAVNDEAGARAAVRYFYDVINYSLVVPESKAALEIASELCDYCTGMNDTAEKLVADGQRVASDGVSLRSVDAIRRLSDVAWIASTTAEYMPVVMVKSDGTVVGRQQTGKTLEDQLVFIYQDGEWKLDALGERAF